MGALAQYVIDHTERGECRCGKCIDVLNKPNLEGHTVDMAFFNVAKRGEATLEEFERLTNEHKGDFCNVNPFDGREHDYLELGGWLGDQGLAMQYMALGVLLHKFVLLSPAMLGISGPRAVELAGTGFLAVVVKR
jgi:hypothetical protein